MRKKPLTPGYIFFYLLFWPDTWRIIAALAAALFVPPRIMPPDQGFFGSLMFAVMIAAIGYTLAGAPARAITRFLKKAILGDRVS